MWGNSSAWRTARPGKVCPAPEVLRQVLPVQRRVLAQQPGQPKLQSPARRRQKRLGSDFPRGTTEGLGAKINFRDSYMLARQEGGDPKVARATMSGVSGLVVERGPLLAWELRCLPSPCFNMSRDRDTRRCRSRLHLRGF